MSSTNILGLLGGLALFLYGMQMMSNGLESVAGNKMKDILEKLTSNRFLGIIVGEGKRKRLQKYVNRKKLVILVLVASKNNTILFDVL